MTDTVRASAEIVIHPDDTEPLAFIFEDAIPGDATLTTPSIASISPSGELALAGAVVNTATFNDRPNDQGDEVPVGKAVFATPSGQVAGSVYKVTVKATLTGGTNSGDKNGVWTVVCEDGT